MLLIIIMQKVLELVKRAAACKRCVVTIYCCYDSCLWSCYKKPATLLHYQFLKTTTGRYFTRQSKSELKTLICLVLCTLVASAYSPPTSNRAEIEALLRNLQEQAEIEGWFSRLKNIAKKVAPCAKKGYDIYKSVNGGAEMQHDDDDDDITCTNIEALQKQAAIEAFISNLQDVADIQSFWSIQQGKLDWVCLERRRNFEKLMAYVFSCDFSKFIPDDFVDHTYTLTLLFLPKWYILKSLTSAKFPR